ncbi:MAG: MBL fold metallo-hydrolase [Balneola sp.]|nr:MBL fold metallo-hydrolase [Balneola sp.]|tara:strand:+ start:53962 stop:54666 length:705 start_codon:yes stop_codon:yes gene_type:complete
MGLKINHIASGSSGNAILVTDGQTTIMMDAGLSYRNLSRLVDLTKVDAFFITHEHMDHCKAVEELLRRGQRVYASSGTRKALLEKGQKVEGLSVLLHGSQIEVGSFYVKAFDLIHDAEEPLGYMFQSMVSKKDKGVYISDSAYVQYDFSGITHFVIECNYAEDILEEGKDPYFLKERIRRSHFSFEKLQQFFAESDLSAAEEIHLVHLSDRNSNAEKFVNEIQKQTGVPTYVLE